VIRSLESVARTTATTSEVITSGHRLNQPKVPRTSPSTTRKETSTPVAPCHRGARNRRPATPTTTALSTTASTAAIPAAYPVPVMRICPQEVNEPWESYG
jgi:hypothetical protein